MNKISKSKTRCKKYRKKILEISQNVKADFSHAEDICFAIYKLIKSNKKINKLYSSTSQRLLVLGCNLWILCPDGMFGYHVVSQTGEAQ